MDQNGLHSLIKCEVPSSLDPVNTAFEAPMRHRSPAGGNELIPRMWMLPLSFGDEPVQARTHHIWKGKGQGKHHQGRAPPEEAQLAALVSKRIKEHTQKRVLFHEPGWKACRGHTQEDGPQHLGASGCHLGLILKRLYGKCPQTRKL